MGPTFRYRHLAPTPHGNFESSRDDSVGLIQIKNLDFTRIVFPTDDIASVAGWIVCGLCSRGLLHADGVDLCRVT
jgi:hypothetical protein